MAGLRFNPPPGWPPLPPGSEPGPGWRPDPAWPPPPPGWQLWVDDRRLAAADPPGAGYQPQAGSWPAPGQPGPSGWPEPSPPAGTNGWAIASFVLGLVGGALLSVIFGIIGLQRIRKTGEKGSGLAIAGLALSAAWLVGVLVVAVVLVGSHAGNGAKTSEGTVSAAGIDPFSLKVGNCFDNPVGATGVASVALISCTQAHNAQVYATFVLTGSDQNYPGEAATTKLASHECMAWKSVLNPAELTNTMQLRFIYPASSQWAAGERMVICLVVNAEPTLTSSMLGSGPG